MKATSISKLTPAYSAISEEGKKVVPHTSVPRLKLIGWTWPIPEPITVPSGVSPQEEQELLMGEVASQGEPRSIFRGREVPGMGTSQCWGHGGGGGRDGNATSHLILLISEAKPCGS